MSFFGFDTTLSRDRAAHAPHPQQAPGFSQQRDAFAGLSGNSNEKAGDDGYEFDDTYDGLGDDLDEGDDEFNDETFGGGSAAAPGKDFDFFGSTAKVADAINEEQLLYARGPKKSTQPVPPTYHQERQTKAPSYVAAAKPKPQPAPKHQIPTEIPELKPEMSLWATTSPEATPAGKGLSAHAAAHFLHIENQEPPAQPNFGQPAAAAASAAPAARKYKSLEEVEAEILAKKQARLAAAQQPSQPQLPPSTQLNQQDGWPGRPVQGFPQHPQMQMQQPPLQQMELPFPPRAMPPPQQNQRLPQSDRAPEHLHRGPMPPPGGQIPFAQIPPNQQFQNNNIPFQMGMMPPQGPQPFVGIPPMQPQIMQMTEEERVKFLEEESKRLKRNHKIAQLSRYNGLMTPSDKNFITRIQLQQLVSVNEDSFNEDFYYQVYMAIRARNNPQQPLNQFAQTYLGQQGARGGRARRQDNHLLRMQQQVQRAVAAAKARPKASQLVLEGSLGKISFSNVKTPKPLLSIKKQDSVSLVEPGQKPAHSFAGIDRRSILAAAEDIYRCLLDLDSHERKHPGPSLTGQQPDANTIQWFEARDGLIAKLWRSMRIMEPIKEEPNALHPFIAILSVKKAKEAIPRVFRYIDVQQRITILTMITISLDQVDVIKDGRYPPDSLSLSNETKKKIEGFSQYVLPPLLSYVGDAQLDVITGLLGILLDRVNVLLLSQTQIGLAFLTMFTSRAEIIKQAGQADEQAILKWTQTYDRLFEILEHHLLDIFPPPGAQVDDMYVWQFLASMAVGASILQQQKMVSAVRDRVNENIQASRTLPQEMSRPKLANTNLFLRALGLDIDQLLSSS
ncbi:hypothetical protein TWF730_010300 [Orbilia blumenaviensis]|uniref:mRNA decay factor PAT1 domain-containing protein n=1 Tax=Orbilia blumenaviensis TaxID=1796055 RepID=A0AAV9URQ8_9PEZI